MRTFVFEARTPELARQWMEEICKASGKFVLKGSPQGGFHSERADDRGQAKANWLLAGTQTGGETISAPALTSGSEMAGSGAGAGVGAERRRSVILDAGRGGRGGGRGRGEAFAAGSSRRASLKMGELAQAAAAAGMGSNPADYGAPIDFGPGANKQDVLTNRRGSRRASGRGFERRTSASNIPIAPGNI